MISNVHILYEGRWITQAEYYIHNITTQHNSLQLFGLNLAFRFMPESELLSILVFFLFPRRIPSLELFFASFLTVTSFTTLSEKWHRRFDLSRSTSPIRNATHQHLDNKRPRKPLESFSLMYSWAWISKQTKWIFGFCKKITLWMAVDGPAVTGRMRDWSSLAASSSATETDDSSGDVNWGSVEIRALRS